MRLFVDEKDALRKRVQEYQVNHAELAQISHNHIPNHGNKWSSNTEGSFEGEKTMVSSGQ